MAESRGGVSIHRQGVLPHRYVPLLLEQKIDVLWYRGVSSPSKIGFVNVGPTPGKITIVASSTVWRTTSVHLGCSSLLGSPNPSTPLPAPQKQLQIKEVVGSARPVRPSTVIQDTLESGGLEVGFSSLTNITSKKTLCIDQSMNLFESAVFAKKEVDER